MPQDARAVESCIGVPDMSGQGLGAAMMRIYAQTLMSAGAPAVRTDPDPSNERAVRAYRRAGYANVAIRPGEDGDPVLVMRFDPNSFW